MLRSLLKVAGSEFELRYARMVQAMSVQEAKAILGLPSSYTPEEFAKAFRKKVMENHPDRGGSTEAMVQVNVAKDVLEGKRRPTFQSPQSQPKPQPEAKPTHKVVETIKGRTFDEAVDGSMAMVDWKVASASRGGDWYYKYLLGQAQDGKWVVLCIRKEEGRDEVLERFPDGSTERRRHEETWAAEAKKFPATSKTLLKSVVAQFKLFASDLEKRRVPPKFLAWPEGVKLSKSTLDRVQVQASGVALKDAMLSAGVFGADDAEVAGRRTQVEIFAKDNEKKKKDLRDAGRTRYRPEEVVDFYLSINGGPPTMLAEETIKNLKMSYIAMWIFDFDFSKRVNITRLRKNPEDMLERIADALTSEPTSVMMGLFKAVEEAKANFKFAAAQELTGMVELIASTSLRSASEVLGLAPIELLGRLYV